MIPGLKAHSHAIYPRLQAMYSNDIDKIARAAMQAVLNAPYGAHPSVLASEACPIHDI